MPISVIDEVNQEGALFFERRTFRSSVTAVPLTAQPLRYNTESNSLFPTKLFRLKPLQTLLTMSHDDAHGDHHDDGHVPLYCRPVQRQKWGEAQVQPHSNCKYSVPVYLNRVMLVGLTYSFFRG